MSEAPALRIEGLRKVFGGTVALADGRIVVNKGEIHGLLGENGAGKSTLIKVLAGAQRPDGGEIELFGEPIPTPYDPDVARGRGLAFIHQDLGLIPDLSVAENIALLVGYARRGFAIDWRAVDHRARQVLAALEVDIDPSAIVASLPLAERATVAIARALAADAKLLVLDEPTATLAAGEVAALFDVLRALRSRGLAIVFVSHRMDEVLSICDRVTVLRDGRTVGAAEIGDVDERLLLRMIVGHDIVPDESEYVRPAAERRFSCVDLRGSVVGPLSFAVHAGEIVGITGLSGSGHLEVGELLFGLASLRNGTMTLDELPYEPSGPRDAIARGLAYVPPDRTVGGVAVHLSVQENLFANPSPRYELYEQSRMIRPARERREARAILSRFDVRPADPARELSTLSGGNAQKVLLAKWLSTRPGLIVLNEPTVGVDVGAREEIYRVIRREVAGAAGAVVITSDFEEAAALCTRVLVLHRGLLSRELADSAISVAAISTGALSLERAA